MNAAGVIKSAGTQLQVRPSSVTHGRITSAFVAETHIVGYGWSYFPKLDDYLEDYIDRHGH